MTSNAGAQAIIEPKKLGFNSAEDPDTDYKRMKDNVMEEVRRIFKPEFLNRIDETIVFHQLTKAELKDIVALQLKDLIGRADRQMGITLKVRDAVKKHIVEKSYDPKYGARPIKRMIQSKIEDVLAESLLRGDFKEGDSVICTLVKNEISFEISK